MPKASAIQNSFNAGELSPTLEGRVDLAKYASGCSKMDNFIPLVQGGARKRSGTRFVKEVKDSGRPSRLIPFEFGTDQAYVLEFGDQYMRVYRGSEGAAGGGVVTEPEYTVVSIDVEAPHTVTVASIPQKTDETCDLDSTTTVAMDSTTGVVVGQSVDGRFNDNTCQITSGNATVITDNKAVLAIGMTVSGQGIPIGAVIDSIFPGVSPKFEMSVGATATLPVSGNLTLTFSPIADGTTVATVGTPVGTFTLSEAALSTKDDVTLKFVGGHGYSTGDEVFIEDTGIDAIDRRFWKITSTGPLTFVIDGLDIGDVLLGDEYATKDIAVASGTAPVVISTSINSTMDITGASQGNPVVIESVDHGFSEGAYVLIKNVLGMTQLNDRIFQVSEVTPDTFQLLGEDGREHTEYPHNGGGTLHGHGYVYGENIYVTGTNLPGIDENYWTISPSGSPYIAFTLIGSDASAYSGYTTTGKTTRGAVAALTGTVARVFTLTTDYGDYVIDDVQVSYPVNSIQYAQSADVLYLAHPDLNPRKVTRTDHHVWTIEIIAFDFVPFEPTNPDTTHTVYASGAGDDGEVGDAVTLTASSALFTTAMEGGHFKLYEIIGSNHGQWESVTNNERYSGDMDPADMVYFENNVYALDDKNDELKTGTSAPVHDSGTESDGKWDWTYMHSGSGYVLLDIGGVAGNGLTATGVVVKQLPTSAMGASNATHRWAHGAWTGKNGYPRTVSFFEDRLWWAGSAKGPQTLWASQTSDYENHEIVDLDESALIFTLNTDQVNVIEWINAGKVLLIGTAGGEFVCSAASETEALVPGNVRVVRHSTYGSKARVSPVRVEQVLLFVQRAGRKLREFVFDDALNSYVAPDMTVLADHITLTGLTRLAFQQEPNRLLWGTLGNGSLVCFTYERAQQVTAWHRHTIGGTGVTVESIAVIPHPNGDQDRLWMIVKRTIDGLTKRYIEYMESEWVRGNAVTSAFFVDSGLSYDDVSTTEIIGLDHLEGETVSILADGATHEDKTVSGGSVTLNRACTTAQIGLSYSSTLQTMRLDAGAADGTAQGKTKRFTNVVIRLDQTGAGLLYGPNDTDADMDELHLRDSYDPMDSGVPLFDGDTEVLSWPAGYEQVGRLTIKHTWPLPCTITAIMPQVVTQDR